MRILLIILSIVNVLCCGWILLQFPIIKLDTDWAVGAIETKYLRSDLTTEERDSFEFFKWSILSNQQVTSEMLASVKVAGIALGATLLVQNLVLLSILNGRRSADKTLHPTSGSVP
jgi:hypothetical protein